MSNQVKMQYRPEIDGLQAIAIIPVIFFHAKLDLLKGRYLGVDVFFVISDYLITNIITKNLQSNIFKFTDFYLWRARRILPALFFIILLCTPISFFTLFPKDYLNFSGSVNTTI